MMSAQKIFEDHTPEDLAEAIIFPVNLSANDRLEADKQLAEHRAQSRLKTPKLKNFNCG